jgi:hypothetical protein
MIRLRFRIIPKSSMLGIGGPWHISQTKGAGLVVSKCGFKYDPTWHDIKWQNVPDNLDSCCERCTEFANARYR